MSETRVIVTGGLGFIGSHIVEALTKRDYTVIVIDKKDLSDNKNRGEFFYHKIDVRDEKEIYRVFNVYKPHYVIHTAAQARIQRGIDYPVKTFEDNCRGTLNVLLASRDSGVKRVIYSASSSVYGNAPAPQKEDMLAMPLNPYALFKYFGEGLCRVFSEIYGLETISLRYFNVYGPGMPLEGIYSTVIIKFLDQLWRGRPFTIVPDGNQRRDFTHVSDIVRANLISMICPNVGRGEVINIGSGKNYSVFELADLIGGEKYPRQFIEPRQGEVRETFADIGKAKSLLNWEPQVSLEEGLRILKG